MRYLFFLLMSFFLLAGCGMGDVVNTSKSTGHAEGVEQMGFSEVQLYNPQTNPDAPYLTTGKTAILAIEAEGTEPLEGDTLDAGNDSLWIKIDKGGYIGMQMEDADLETIDHVQIFDATGSPRLEVDRENRTAEATLPAGVYEFRFHAGHTDAEAKPLFISFTETAGTARSGDSGSIALSAGTDCIGCNLSGVDLSGLRISNINLSGSDFSFSTLTNTEFNNVNLSSSVFYKSKSDEITFYRTDLSHATMYYTNIGTASMTSVNLDSAAITYSTFNTMTLVGTSLNYSSFLKTKVTGEFRLGICEVNYSDFTGAVFNKYTIDRTYIVNSTMPDGRFCFWTGSLFCN